MSEFAELITKTISKLQDEKAALQARVKELTLCRHFLTEDYHKHEARIKELEAERDAIRHEMRMQVGAVRERDQLQAKLAIATEAIEKLTNQVSESLLLDEKLADDWDMLNKAVERARQALKEIEGE